MISEFLFIILFAVCVIELACVLVMANCIRLLIRQLEIEREQHALSDESRLNTINKVRIANGIPPLTGLKKRPRPNKPDRG